MSLLLFSFIDPIPANYRGALPAYFHISAATPYDVILIRLLTSNLKIRNAKNNKIIKLNTNLATFPFHPLPRKSASTIRAMIAPHSLDDYVLYSKKFYGRNINFYHNLLQELVFYFSYTEDKQYVAAFVNLYRTLEYMSYSIPLMHSSHFGNYLGSFKALRSYFLDEKTSEIAFFENFVLKLLQGSVHLIQTTSFDFSHADNVIANNCYDSFHRLMNVGDWVVADRLNHTLQIENQRLLGLIKNTRNRYFHFALGGHRNLQNIDLSDPDFFFSRVNNGFLNWMTFIYTRVVKENLINSFI